MAAGRQPRLHAESLSVAPCPKVASILLDPLTTVPWCCLHVGDLCFLLPLSLPEDVIFVTIAHHRLPRIPTLGKIECSGDECQMLVPQDNSTTMGCFSGASWTAHPAFPSFNLRPLTPGFVLPQIARFKRMFVLFFFEHLLFASQIGGMPLDFFLEEPPSRFLMEFGLSIPLTTFLVLDP